jgi:cytosine deaminase
MLDILVKKANLNGQLKDIGISIDQIVSVQDNIDSPAKMVIEAKGRVLISGFIDCHMHLDKALLNEKENYVEGTGAEKGLLTLSIKKGFTVEDIIKRSEEIINKAIQYGTLAIRTNVDVDESVGLKGIEAMIILREKYKDIITIQIVAFAQEGVFFDSQTQRLLEEAILLGADLIGGHTITKGEGEKHIDFILGLAKKYNLESDFHLDESGNRAHYLLPYLSERIKKLGLSGRVNGIHCCTLSALDSNELDNALSLIQESGLKITIAPTAISTRNLAPVKRLLENGTLIGLGSDNIRDFFNPLGSGDIKQAALLLAHIQRFYQIKEIEQIWSMMTDGGARLLGLQNYGIEVGHRAHLTLFDSVSFTEVIAYTSQPILIVRSGRILKYSSGFISTN